MQGRLVQSQLEIGQNLPAHPRAGPVRVGPFRPIYRMYRYFARRPHQVFQNLVAKFCPPGGLVLDPFSGGGVTVVESLLLRRRVVGIDINPMATFITAREVTIPDVEALSLAYEQLREATQAIVENLYLIDCTRCGQTHPFDWLEWSSTESCPGCESLQVISRSTKVGIGRWKCSACGRTFPHRPTSATHDVPVRIFEGCAQAKLRGPRELVAGEAPWYAGQAPTAELALRASSVATIPIPDNNMQRESALHKKGIVNFGQLWTPRNLLANSLLKQAISRLNSLEPKVAESLWLAFSSSLRYTNRMVTMNEGWRGNRPLEWVKPGFWLPPVYLEPNVWHQFDQRFRVILGTYRDERRRPSNPLITARISSRPADVLNGKADCALVNASATRIPLPDESVDAVITDPPYGNYVHYADLTNFWTAWLHDVIGVAPLLDTTEEAVPARKPGFPGWKSFADYSRLMSRCFKECSRVLRPDGYLVLTFNNREPRAWVALIAAVASGGFTLAESGVYYQDGIEGYKHTAQSRRAGSLIGDFVYSFHKVPRSQDRGPSPRSEVDFGPFLENRLINAMTAHLRLNGPSQTSDLFRSAYLAIQDDLFAYVKSKVDESQVASDQLLASAERISTFDSTRSASLRHFFKFNHGLWTLGPES
jgi:SAM-dependent methyltransferase